MKELKYQKNYADAKSGATVLRSDSNIINKSAILENSDNVYLIMPKCHEEKASSVVISLSDDVQVDNILVSNLEDFSANLQSIVFYGSIDYPPSGDWIKLGSIQPQRGVRAMQ